MKNCPDCGTEFVDLYAATQHKCKPHPPKILNQATINFSDESITLDATGSKEGVRKLLLHLIGILDG